MYWFIIIKYALIILACMFPTVYADELKKGCDIKVIRLQKQIDYAKAHGNTYKVAGLEKALENVKKNCTEKDLTQDINRKILEKEQKVADRESDLKKAQAKGDANKILKQQKKLIEAQQELKEAQQSYIIQSK